MGTVAGFVFLSLPLLAFDLPAQPSENCAALRAAYRVAQSPASISRASEALRSASCNRELASVLSDRMRSMASSRDDEVLTRLARDGMRLRNAALAQSAVELFSNANASDEARWLGFSVALMQSSRPMPLDSELSRLKNRAPSFAQGDLRCYENMITSRPGIVAVDPLPSAKFDTLLADRLRELHAQPGASPFVRGMLNCLWGHYRFIQPALEPGQIAAVNECDNRWFVTTSYQHDQVIVSVGPADAPGEYRIQVAAGAQSFADLPFASDMVVRSRGKVILRAPHAHVSCMAKRFRDAGKPLPPDHDTLSGWQWRSRRPER